MLQDSFQSNQDFTPVFGVHLITAGSPHPGAFCVHEPHQPQLENIEGEKKQSGKWTDYSLGYHSLNLFKCDSHFYGLCFMLVIINNAEIIQSTQGEIICRRYAIS